MAIDKVAVIGAGLMGGGIAAHVANAGIDVILLDINIADRLFDRHKAMFLLLSQKSFTRHL